MPEVMPLSTIPVIGPSAERLAEGDALNHTAGHSFSEILPEYLQGIETVELAEEETQSILAMLLIPPQGPSGNGLPQDLPPGNQVQGAALTDDSQRVQAFLDERAARQFLAKNWPDGIAAAEGAIDVANAGEFAPMGEELGLKLPAEGELEPGLSPEFPLKSLEDAGLGVFSGSKGETPGLGTAELRGMPSPSQTPNLSQPQAMPAREVSLPIFSVDTPFHDEKWSQAFASKIAWQITGDIQEAQIHMNPPELGPIEVRVRVDEDQAAVYFHTHHGQVRETIERAIPELRDILSQSGLHLADANVSQGSSGQEWDRMGRLTPSLPEASGIDTIIQEEPVPLSAARHHAGLIDAYV